MSSSTKRKHVYAEVLQSELRVPTESQEIVRVVAGRGNNLHEVESATEGTFLVTMPSKFRKNVWVKRGDYILVERIPEGDKLCYIIQCLQTLEQVKAEIVAVLTKNHIRFFKNQNCWPEIFLKEVEKETAIGKPTFSESSSSSSSESSSEED